MRVVKEHRSFGGIQRVCAHASTATQTTMRFSVYVPPAAKQGRVPAVYFLSGLTCTEDNFTTKGGAQRYAAELGVALVVPDTSPRNLGLPGEDDDWDFGTGAGFYVDATEAPWSSNYRMFTYVTEELPALVERELPIDPAKRSIFGHSMGGHGALVIAFRLPDRYRSVSAFAPISAPMRCPWGEKAFTGYLGPDREAWKAYDATELARTTSWRRRVLVDQGTTDEFLDAQLKPELLADACDAAHIPLTLRTQDGYDHSYYFISTFVGDHLSHHADALKA